jgi:acyl-CoA thioester hydrolase
MKKPYFKHQINDPEPLRAIVSRRVRFNEIDSLNIMWHGNYASYFEDGRIALGKKYDIGYMDFYSHDVIIPLKKFHVDFIAPLKFDDECQIETLLHWNEAARLDFSFNIYRGQELMTTGYSVHLMLDAKGNVLVVKPDFFVEMCNRWKDGQLK